MPAARPTAACPSAVRSSRAGRAAALLLASAACAAPLFAQGAPGGAGAAGAAARPDSAVFVTRLGADTLALERVVRTPGRVEADVVLRVPRTTRTRYVLELTPAGQLARMEAVTTTPPGAPAPARREVVTRVGDSLRIETTGGGGESGAAAGGAARTRMVAADATILPFIDMVHWPYEVALVRARQGGGPAAFAQPLLTGARESIFRIAPVGADSVTITHPYRGTMRASVDAGGRLLGLDAGATTRKLRVERRPWMPIEALVERWAAQDAAGRSLGALSGRAEETESVGPATLAVDYGTPQKRGRTIWGALVPYGQVWRTGANQATHFSTDRDLVLGAGADTLVVPAGRYTLFSVPAADGGVLIVNRQTGQAGTAHDPAQDLGRVRLTTRRLAEPVEVFTIDVAPTTAGAGELRLRWDAEERVVPFRVR